LVSNKDASCGITWHKTTTMWKASWGLITTLENP
jgi:hypothetical protein